MTARLACANAGCAALSSAVVGIFLIAVVGGIADAREFRDLLQQGFLHTFLQRDVDHATTLAAAAETQYGYLVFRNALQADVAAVAGEAGIDLVVQHVVDAVFEAAVRTDARHARVGRTNGQLPAHAVLGIVNHG